MSEDPHLEGYKKLTTKQGWLIGLLLLLVIATFFGLRVSGCSVEPKKETVVQPAPPPPPPPPPPGGTNCPDGSAPGTTRNQACPQGQVGNDAQVCSAAGTWLDVTNTCTAPPPPACTKTVYADVQPLFQTYCAGCHNFGGSYAAAQSYAAQIAIRVGDPTGNTNHMPPIGQNQLCTLPSDSSTAISCDKVTLLQKWVSDGALQNCAQASNPTFIDLDYQDGEALNDAASISATDRPFILYLYMGHAIDAGLSADTQKTWVQAASKTLNSLNPVSQNLTPVQSVEPAGAVWRVDLRNYGVNSANLTQVVNAIDRADSNINIIDQTSKGQALAALLGKRKPWYHLDNFIDVTFRNSDLYYLLLKVPPKLVDLQKLIGVNFDSDLASLQNVNFLGFNNSPIAEQKNRLIVRDVEQRDQTAAYWQTFDVNGTPHNIQVVVNGVKVLEDTKNLFQFPLLAGTGAQALPPGATLIYTPDASEVIWTLPNGLHGYALYDGVGNRLNFADPNVVIDTETPLGNRIINTANSCVRCHNGGFIPAQDQVLASVTRTALPNANDNRIVKQVYGAAAASSAFFKKDNSYYTAALTKLGIDSSKPDPMNVTTDRFLENWDENNTCAFLFLKKALCEDAINSSSAALAQFGGLLNGQNVTFAQYVGAEQALLADSGAFEDKPGN